MVTLTVLPSSETLQSLWYDGVRTGTLRAVWKSALTEIESCNVGTKPTSGNWFVAKATAGKWFMCPVGTTAAAIPADQSADKFCEGIAANYYGTKGNVASAHAKQTGGGATDRPTACPFGGTSAASPSTTTTISACTPKCGSGTNAEANTGTCRCKADYYGTPKDANGAALAIVTQGCTACPSSANAAAGSTAIESCNVGTKPTSGNWFVAAATSGKWVMCPEGTTAAAVPANQDSNKFCEGIAAGYWGTKGAVGSAHAKKTGGGATDRPTACTTTFSDTTKDTATGITSAASPATTTDKTACKTKPGYIITSAVNAADGDITVEKAGSGTYAAGGTALVTADGANKGTAKQTANACPYGGTTTATGQDAGH